jgi:hypothetical protein
MYYSLFREKIIEVPGKDFPKNVFGVFSTIRRHSKLKMHPVDIHGCIGYWDNNFNSLTEKDISYHLLRVSYDSVWTDSRNKYFPPIQTDPYSLLELDFMLNPIYKINRTTGVIEALNRHFSNKNFGIIIETTDKSQRATYLPGVFLNISWNELIESIKNKANITHQDFNLYAYKIKQIKSSYITLLTGEIFSYVSIFKFTRFLLDNMKSNMTFPFGHTYHNKILKWNSDDDVRNISTLSEVYRYIKLYSDIASKQEKEIVKQKLIDVMKNIDKYSSQALSFVGFAFPQLRISSSRFCQKLLEDLPLAESEFARPEIMIGLNKAGCKMKIKYSSLTFEPTDSIFKMNWIIQAIVSFHKKPSSELILLLEDKVNEIINSKQQKQQKEQKQQQVEGVETNYLAVAFEALCFAFTSTPSNKRNSILLKMFQLFFELEKRKTQNNALYTFLDKSARVDISGHVNNGLVELTRKWA